ncbi:hypothetical protein VTK73DRAFT_8307 [Phialemonium thermophilum]|uniref:Glycosylphosphatidylinositol anchor biosynthesis protein 11 n=1 Tax=Phialemonium thermophilum TaxID=223376 RepID=A0ABR3W9A4_9PEZI
MPSSTPKSRQAPASVAAPPAGAAGSASPSTTKPAGASITALHPVRINPSPAARAARHIHPVLLLSLFVYGFRSLVADPVSWMWRSLPVLIAIQAVYAVVCLPVAGSQSAKAAKKTRPGEKKNSADSSGPNAILAAFLSLLLSVLVAPFFHVGMVLFGAPLLTHIPHTLYCSLHLSILTLFPLIYVHGVDSTSWVAIAGFRAPFDETFGGLVGGVVGAWLGAVPIPLDWDREWQKWPVTILCGIYGGYILGKVVGGSLLLGKKF